MSYMDMYAILMEIKQDIGAIKSTTESTNRWLAQHVEDDKALAEDVKRLELQGAKRKGAEKVWGLVYGAGGAILGTAVSFLVELWKQP